MSNFAIGDVHGCIWKLHLLLASLPQNAFLIFVGDLIHKGPNSKGVVDVVRELCEEGRAVVVRGNHETMVGKVNGKFYEDEVGLTEEDGEWLRSRPLFIRDENENLFLHAGMDQGSTKALLQGLIDDGHLPEGGEWTEAMVNEAVASLSKGKQGKLGKVMFIRKLSPKGTFVPLNQECPDDTWWSSKYEGDFGHIFYGHQPWENVRFDEHATGIDTGAYDNGKLTAINVNTKEVYQV